VVKNPSLVERPAGLRHINSDDDKLCITLLEKANRQSTDRKFNWAVKYAAKRLDKK